MTAPLFLMGLVAAFAMQVLAWRIIGPAAIAAGCWRCEDVVMYVDVIGLAVFGCALWITWLGWV